MHDVPHDLRTRPVHRSEALAAGVTRSVLQGPQFRRVHEAVYCFASHEMTFADRLRAARLALPLIIVRRRSDRLMAVLFALFEKQRAKTA